MTSKRICLLFLVCLAGLALLALLDGAPVSAQTGASNAAPRAFRNPPPFENFAVAPSAPVRFLASEEGRRLLRASPNPKAQEILRALERGQSAAGTSVAPPGLLQAETTASGPIPTLPGTITGCGTSYGTRFNLESLTGAVPQNEESLDLLLSRVSAGTDLVMMGANDYRALFYSGGLGFSVTGYYVNRDSDCDPEFEGGLPTVEDPLEPGNYLYGNGDPVVAADPVRDAFFMADLRFDGSTTAIGVFRTTSTKLLDVGPCPGGTHDELTASGCWSERVAVNPLPGTFAVYFQDKPHLAVDERSSGAGAGNVYITASEFNFFTFFSRIWLVACTNNLSDCSAPVLVSGSDYNTQFSHVAVRPDGRVTVTYINVSNTGAYDIKYVSCLPHAAPANPSCGTRRLVTSELQPLRFGGWLAAQDFRIATYPKHDHRQDANGTEAYVVWDRCRVAPVFDYACPEADVWVAASANDGASWSKRNLYSASQDQFFPWIKTDRSTNVVNIVYYSTQNDTFQHLVQVFLRHIDPGASTPDANADLFTLTTLKNDPAADLWIGGYFFGDYIGVAVRGTGVAGQSRSYTGFTFNNIQATWVGLGVPQQNNHLSRVDY